MSGLISFVIGLVVGAALMLIILIAWGWGSMSDVED